MSVCSTDPPLIHLLARIIAKSSLRSHDKDEPILQWYRIQDQIRESEADILLLLDCCFAAQTGRENRRGGGRFEVLAASAMGMKTPLPGEGSFTNILIKAIRGHLQNEESVNVKDLHGLICDRRHALYATPVHITLKTGKSPIFLRPIQSDPVSVMKKQGDEFGSIFSLLIRMREEMDENNAEKLAQWLKTDVPHIVSHIEVMETTQHIHNVVCGITSGEMALSDHVEAEAREEIKHAWQNIIDLAARYPEIQVALRRDPGRGLPSPTHQFLVELNAENERMVDTLERNLLNTTGEMDQGVLDSTAADDSVQALGIADAFQMRKIIQLYASSTDIKSGIGELSNRQTNHVLQETKGYGPYLNPRDIPSVERRVRLLCELLAAPKSRDFRTLQCRGWAHHPLEYSFTLTFEVPQELDARQYVTLKAIIQKSRGAERPSFDDRLKIALMLAKAVQKWHSVDWVHQGINSLNIIFFKQNIGGTTSKSGKEIGYGMPFLHGFEYSRPDPDPSIGHPSSNDKTDCYRHPEVQGLGHQKFLKKHDIYSLGVVLLEIGLWQTAEEIIKTSRRAIPTTTGVVKEKSQERSVFLHHCSERLAHYAGERYRDAVDACLSSDFGVNLDDQSGSRLARAFQSRIIDTIASGPRMT